MEGRAGVGGEVGSLLNLYTSTAAWNTCRIFELGMLFSFNTDMGHRHGVGGGGGG